MNARETLAGWMASSKGGKYVFPGDYDQADDLLATLTAAGFTITHRDENHGPTLERAATLADLEADRHNAYDLKGPKYKVASRIASAIRAMEVKL